MARRKRSRERIPLATESRSADFMTVGWLLATLTTLVCVSISLASLVLIRVWPDQTGLELLTGLMLFAGLVIGLVSIVMLVVVLRTRVERPPQSLVVGSIVLALVPPVMLSMRALGWL